MENLIDSQHGVSVLLASIAIALCMNVLVKIAELLFSYFKRDKEVTNDNIKNLSSQLSINTDSLRQMVSRMDDLAHDVSEVVKYKKDIRNLFTAVKALAGPQWSEIRKSIIEDDITS